MGSLDKSPKQKRIAHAKALKKYLPGGVKEHKGTKRAGVDRVWARVEELELENHGAGDH